MDDDWVKFPRDVSDNSFDPGSTSAAFRLVRQVENKASGINIGGEEIVELYDGIRPSLKAYLSLRGLSTEHSEDVIQEAFLRLVRHSSRRETNDNLRAWIFRVAHNLSMDFHRSRKRLPHSAEIETDQLLQGRIDPAPNPEQEILLQERRRRLRAAYVQLTPRQRDCLRLRAKGLRYQEIALVMGVSVQRVGELMQRAISRVELGS